MPTRRSKKKTKPRVYSCNRCFDSKHYSKDGKFYRCDCLREQRLLSQYKEARIPERYSKLSWRQFLHSVEIDQKDKAILVDLANNISEKDNDWIFVNCREEETLAKLANLFLITACNSNISCAYSDLPEIIELEFKRKEFGNKELSIDINNLGVLVLLLGDEPSHKFNRYFLEDLLRKRWGKKLFTVIVSTKSPGTVSRQYNSPLIKKAIDNQFNDIFID